MGLQNSLLAGHQIVSIILQEGSSFGVLDPFRHNLHQAHHGRGLPVSLSGETVALLHQSLDGKARQLLQRAQIAEMGHDCMVILLLQEALEADFNAGLYRHMAPELRRVSALVQNLVSGIILFHQPIDIALADIRHIFRDLVDRIRVDFPAELNLSLHLVTLCDGHVAHIVRHSRHTDMAGLHDPHRRAHPSRQPVQGLLIAPVPHNHFAFNTHAGHDMAVFPVAVCRLVLVHEIHVDGIVRNFHIELCMQMAQGLAVLLQAQDPGLGRRERMHPGDDAGALPVHVRLVEQSPNHLIGEQRRLPHHLIGKQTRLVDFLHDDP